MSHFWIGGGGSAEVRIIWATKGKEESIWAPGNATGGRRTTEDDDEDGRK